MRIFISIVKGFEIIDPFWYFLPDLIPDLKVSQLNDVQIGRGQTGKVHTIPERIRAILSYQSFVPLMMDLSPQPSEPILIPRSLVAEPYLQSMHSVVLSVLPQDGKVHYRSRNRIYPFLDTLNHLGYPVEKEKSHASLPESPWDVKIYEESASHSLLLAPLGVEPCSS
jgi:hypothetical protein